MTFSAFSRRSRPMPPVSTSVKDAPAPFGLGADAVARDARFVMDDGDALADDAIKQRGLSDIGPSHNGDKARHSLRMR